MADNIVFLEPRLRFKPASIENQSLIKNTNDESNRIFSELNKKSKPGKVYIFIIY